MIALDRLRLVLDALPQSKIALVGDLFLDRYLEIDASLGEPSLETGLEAHQVAAVRNSPGALGTVINNLAALGAGQLLPVTVLGDDGHGYDLLRALRPLPVDPQHVVMDENRVTPTYTKPMRRGDDGLWHELNRLDLRTRGPLSPTAESKLLDHLELAFAAADGLIVLDQVHVDGHGVVTPRVRRRLVDLARREPHKLIFIDSRAHIDKFTCGTLKPNSNECLAAAGMPPEGDQDAIAQAAEQLASKTACPVFCTMGSRGILVVESGKKPAFVPGVRVAGPIDIVGAGDSATAGIVSSLLAGATPAEAASVGNLVASITIEQLGTTGTAHPAQVLDRWHTAQRQ